MPGTEESKVPVEPTPGVVPANEPGTPPEGGVAETTPTQSTVDAEALSKERQEFLERQKSLQKDINRLKSLSQSREAQIKKEAAERERRLREELEQIRVSTMDEETRKQYESQSAQEKIRELQDQLAEAQTGFENYRIRQNAIMHFRKLGVPDDVLGDELSVDDLIAAGWEWVSNEVIEMKNKPAGAQTEAAKAPAPLPKAPPVDTGKGTPGSSRPTWEDVEKKYGSREKFFQLFQEGRIPKSQVPE